MRFLITSCGAGRLAVLAALLTSFGLAQCQTTPATRVIIQELKGCPVYEEEVAFPTLSQEQPVAVGTNTTEPPVYEEPEIKPEPEPEVAAVVPEAETGAKDPEPEPEVEPEPPAENDLDRVYKTVRKEFENSDLKLQEIANGFREKGLSVEKRVGPDGKVTKELVISIDGDVSFAHGSHRLTKRAQSLVEKVGAAMVQYPNAKARIGGHTDSTGPFSFNKRLSLRRARSVESALIKKHKLPRSQIIEVKGYADTQKIVDTMKSEPRNRRVEIRVSLD